MAIQFLVYPPSSASIAGTVNTNLVQVGGSAITLGQKTSANSIPAVIASDQSAIPVSAASLPLPAGAATAANQTNGNQQSQIVQGGNTATVTVAGALKTDGSAVTQPVSAASLPLPTGASTAANQTSVQSAPGVSAATAVTVQGSASGVAIPISGTVTITPSGTQDVNVTKISGAAISTAASGIQKVGVSGATGVTLDSAAGTPNGQAVTIQGNASGVAVPVSGTITANAGTGTFTTKEVGLSSVSLVRNAYASVNVTTAAYVQLIASTSAAISVLDIFDSSGQTLVLATGAAASEVDKIYIYPGGNGRVPLAIPASTRVSIKAVSANATTGELDINFLG